MDLGSALREVQRKTCKDKDLDNPQLLLGVRDIVDLVKEEQSFLSGSEQQVLVGILPTRTYYPEDINFQMDRLCLKATDRTWKEQIIGLLWVRDHRSWDLTVNRKFLDDSKNKSLNQDSNVDTEQTIKDPFAKLPPRPAAWFILLHDLAWEWSPDSINENLIQTLSEELNDWELFVEDKPELDKKSYVDSEQRFYTKPKKKDDPLDYFSGWAVWHNGTTYKHFPMPEFKTFRDLDRFLYVWSRGIDWLESRRKLAEEAQKKAQEAKAKASIARQQADEEQVEGAETDEAKKKVANAVKEEDNATTIQKHADEAQEVIGVDTTQQLSRVIHLWGLAASIIRDKQSEEQYKNFAEIDSKPDGDWFGPQLKTFVMKEDNNPFSNQGWKTIKDLL